MLIENLVPLEGWQILWQREQILITSIFSVSHNIFTCLDTQGFLESVVRGIVVQPFLSFDSESGVCPKASLAFPNLPSCV